MANSLPTYIVDLDSAEWTGLALVTDPAIESNMQFFSRESVKFSVQDADKRIVFGPCLRVDYPIIRQASDGSYYNIVFTKEVAQKMVSQFLSSDVSLNLSHTCIFPEGIEPLSFFIKDSSKGINPVGYDDIADGSIFCSYHISNDELWTAVKEGTFKGFSIECFYDRNLISDSDMSFSSIFTRLKQAFAELNVVKANPTDLFVEGELVVGAKVYIDEVTPAPDGVYVSIADEPQDIVVEDGVVESINAHVEVKPEPKAEEPAMEEPAKEEPAKEDMGCGKKNMEEEVPAEEPVAEPVVEEVPAVEPKEDPIEAIKASMEELAARITAIESRIADIEGAPAGNLPADEFKSVKSTINSFGTGIEAIKAMRANNKIR